MNSPGELSIRDFEYELPNERIAKYPLSERDASKLLIYRDEAIQEDVYRNIADWLPENAILFFNNTKVIRARLFFTNATGGKIEIFCLEPNHPAEVAMAMSAEGTCDWNVLVGGLSKWRDAEIHLKQNGFSVKATMLKRGTDTHVVRFTWTPAKMSFAEMLDAIGALPIPPYLKRSTESIDHERYQTVYAQHEGSVAAPTAGLHFTPAIFGSLKKKQIDPMYLTLHVGAGTFKPVKADKMQDHEMHAESIDIPIELIRSIVQNHERTRIVVGTTSMRTLESLYWLGVKLNNDPAILPAEIGLNQWEAYQLSETVFSPEQAMKSLLHWMEKNELERLCCSTAILIAPGYVFRMTDALITNFHQPGSTLILLVAAAIGDNWRKVYDYALANDFRFLSYGDGSLLYLSNNKN